MEMCYNGALVMPSNYAVVNSNEMEYVEGGGTAYVSIGKNSFVVGAVAAIAGYLTTTGVKIALNAIGGVIATAIQLGTAGAGTLVAGAFIIAWGGIVATLAGYAVSYGVNYLKGKKFKIANGAWIPNITLTI